MHALWPRTEERHRGNRGLLVEIPAQKDIHTAEGLRTLRTFKSRRAQTLINLGHQLKAGHGLLVDDSTMYRIDRKVFCNPVLWASVGVASLVLTGISRAVWMIDP